MVTEPSMQDKESQAAPHIWPWILVLACVASLIQLMLPTFFDSDTAYHLAVARLIRMEGFLHHFPATPFSWLAEHYADKELLFHLLLVPLANLDPSWASRIAGAVLGTAILSVLFLILRGEGASAPGLWTLLALASSSAFVARFAMVRPHLLSLLLALVILWSAVRKRYPLLAVVVLLFPLSYTAWHVPLALAGIVFLADLTRGRPAPWRLLVITVVALLVGISVHPNFPQNVRLFWIQNVEILFNTAWTGRSGFDLGGEFRPFSLLGFGRMVLPAALLTLYSSWLAWGQRNEDSLPLAAAMTALGFLVMTLMSQRFIEYLAPFAVLAAALSFKTPRLQRLVPLMILLAMVHMALWGRYPLNLLRHRSDLMPPRAAELMREIIPPGAQIVTCDWRFTGELMLALPQRKFLVALDPFFFAVHDSRRYQIWFEAMRDPPPRVALLLRDTFAAQYQICLTQPQWGALLAALDHDQDAALRGVIGPWRIYQFRPVPHP